MIPGDIRGDYIPNTYGKTSIEEAGINLVGASLGMALPVAAIGGFVGFNAGFAVAIGAAGRGAIKAASAARGAVSGVLSGAAAAGQYAGTIAGFIHRSPALSSMRRRAFRTIRNNKVATGVGALIGAGLIGSAIQYSPEETAMALGTGLGVGSVAIGSGYLMTRRWLPPSVMAGAVAAASGAAAWNTASNHQQQFEASRARFISSANGYMARGAANRNRSQGYF